MFLHRNHLLAGHPPSERVKSNLFRNLFALLLIPAGVGMFLDAPPAGAQNAYITNQDGNTVSAINTASNAVTAAITGLSGPFGVAVTPDGTKVYVTNIHSSTVSVIDTATNTVTGSPISVGSVPYGLAVTADKVYVANFFGDTVSVIDTATNTVAATVTGFSGPVAFGIFIQPASRFAGSPGQPNCYGKSVSALAKKYGGLDAAAKALGFPSVQALKNAIESFCGK
jgi:YVTN family beta-propeller protein